MHRHYKDVNETDFTCTAHMVLNIHSCALVKRSLTKIIFQSTYKCSFQATPQLSIQLHLLKKTTGCSGMSSKYNAP